MAPEKKANFFLLLLVISEKKNSLMVDRVLCWLIPAGFPEGVREEDGKRSGPQTFGQGANWQQPRWLVLGQSADAGAEHSLGDGVQPLGVQTGPAGAGPVSGTVEPSQLLDRR